MCSHSMTRADSDERSSGMPAKTIFEVPPSIEVLTSFSESL